MPFADAFADLFAEIVVAGSGSALPVLLWLLHIVIVVTAVPFQRNRIHEESIDRIGSFPKHTYSLSLGAYHLRLGETEESAADRVPS